MIPRPRALAAAALIVALAALPGRAVMPVRPPAPEFPDHSAWVNSVPFKMERFKGRRVVLVSFINCFSINSIRTFKQLEHWWDRYALEGLMVIGVHNPDYEFDRDPLYVREAVKRFGLKFPVLIDSAGVMWDAYENTGWPAHYLIDHNGGIIHDRVGEGGYAEFEREILAALWDFNGYRPPKKERAGWVPKEVQQERCGDVTPSMYLGGRRGVETIKVRPKRLEALLSIRAGEVATLGEWNKESDALRYAGIQRGHRDHIRLIYYGAEVMATLSRFGGKPARFFVKQGNLWLHAGNANKDIKWDFDDRSYVLVDKPRLFFLTKNKKKEKLQELALYPEKTGMGISSFEFSDQCQATWKKKKKKKAPKKDAKKKSK